MARSTSPVSRKSLPSHTPLPLTCGTHRTDNGTALWLMQEGLPGISESDIQQIFALYPSDPADGSPFDTGDLYAITPQYKRIAAIIGDIEYHSQRRFFLTDCCLPSRRGGSAARIRPQDLPGLTCVADAGAPE